MTILAEPPEPACSHFKGLAPIYSGKVNLTLVKRNPMNRALIMSHVDELRDRFDKTGVQDLQYPLILSTLEPEIVESLVKREICEGLQYEIGHHRGEAFLQHCDFLGLEDEEKEYICHVFDASDPDVQDYLRVISLNADDPRSIPDYFHVAFQKILGKDGISEIANGGRLSDEDFGLLRLKSTDKSFKSLTKRVIGFYGKYPNVLKDFEESFYYPIFKHGGDLSGDHFNITFLSKLVKNIPASFIVGITKRLSQRYEENRQIMDEVISMYQEDPFISIIEEKNLDPNECVKKLPGLKIVYRDGKFRYCGQYQNWKRVDFAKALKLEITNETGNGNVAARNNGLNKSASKSLKLQVIEGIKKLDGNIAKNILLKFVEGTKLSEKNLKMLKSSIGIPGTKITKHVKQNDSSVSIPPPVMSLNAPLVKDGVNLIIESKKRKMTEEVVIRSGVSSMEQDVLKEEMDGGGSCTKYIDNETFPHEDDPLNLILTSQDSGYNGQAIVKSNNVLLKNNTINEIVERTTNDINPMQNSTERVNFGNDASLGNGTQEMDINLPSSALEQYAAGSSSNSGPDRSSFRYYQNENAIFAGSSRVVEKKVNPNVHCDGGIVSSVSVENSMSITDSHIKWAMDVKKDVGELCLVCLMENNKLVNHDWMQCKTKNGKCLKCFHPQQKQIHDGKAVYICSNGANCQAYKISSPDESIICFYCLFPKNVGVHKGDGYSLCTYRPNDLKYLLIKMYLQNNRSNKKPIGEYVTYLIGYLPNQGLYRYQIIIKSLLKMKLKKE